MSGDSDDILSDDEARAADIANLVDTWLEAALDEIEDAGALSALTIAALFGARLRSRDGLLLDDRWEQLLEQVPHPDDQPPATREADAAALASSLRPMLERAAAKLEEQHRLWDSLGGVMPDEVHDADVDASVRLVDELDALSLVAVYLTWLIDTEPRIGAPKARAALAQVDSLLTQFGEHADCLPLAEHRICAIRASVAHGVLSAETMLSIRQRRTLDSLIPHHRAARQSAMWFAAAAAALYWQAVAISEIEDEADADIADVVATRDQFSEALREHARRMQSEQSSATTVSTDDALAKCARWSIEAARAHADASRSAALAAALFLQPRSLAAADAGAHNFGLRFRWSAPDKGDDRCADCEVIEGLAEAVITFFRGRDLDRGVDGMLVSWLGQTGTARESRVRFTLDDLRKGMTPSTLMSRLAAEIGTLWVGNSPWDCTDVAPTGSPD